MSEVMAVLKVCDEHLICIDFDRPVWISKNNPELKATPSLDHFVVDGILATINVDTLNQNQVTKRFKSEDFEAINPTDELKEAREKIYKASELNIEYFHDHEGDIQIHEDLIRFTGSKSVTNKISTAELYKLSK